MRTVSKQASGLKPVLLVQQMPGGYLRPPATAGKLGIDILPKQTQRCPRLRRHAARSVSALFVFQKAELPCS